MLTEQEKAYLRRAMEQEQEFWRLQRDGVTDHPLVTLYNKLSSQEN